ncbi:DUF362 domain-containing protein [Paludibaculum fermentans]|uniref:DUF362 domain-containing protein n=1 Tax=Paludibaculum fermentans TaxID=1473598 RepID=UPI003EBDE3CF
MATTFTRRGLFGASAGLLLASRTARAATQVPAGLFKGEDRRKNVTAAMRLIDKEITAKLRGRKSVVIKPNMVSTERQLAATHADALNGILDYLADRYKGPVFIAESSAGFTTAGFDNFKYQAAIDDHKKMNIKLVDLNEEAEYETLQILDANLQIQPVRLAKRLLDPDAFVISAGLLKTHNVVIATMNIKNMALGAPLHYKRGEAKRWNDKRVYHGGVRQTHYDIMRTAERLKPNWGVAVIDGFEGMEGNGPGSGTPVASRVAIASTDFVAADRIGVECMGVNPEWMGYLQYCEKVGIGTFDRAGIELRGETTEKVQQKYRLHTDIERMMQWMGPLTELPPKLG